MRNKPHTIGKHIFEAEYFSDSNGVIFRQEFTELVKRSLLSVVEEVLNEISPKNALVRLEKIEIELHQVNYPFDEWSLKKQLRKCLRDELNFKVVSIRHQNRNTDQLKDVILFNEKVEEELLLYFLQNGLLPWWYAESKSYSVSIEDLIQQICRSEPRTIVRVLQKVGNFKEQVRRFIYHCSESVLFICIASTNDISVHLLEEFKRTICQIGIETYVKKFDNTFREFLIYTVLLKKKNIQSVSELQAKFVEYLLQQNGINQSGLIDLFPEYFIYSWLKFHFSESLALFDKYVKSISSFANSNDRSLLYNDSIRALLKKIKSVGAVETTKLTKGNILKNEKEHENLDSIKGLFLDNFPGNKGDTENYFNLLEKKVFQYLLYGIIHWEDRIAGITAIEMFILKLHTEAPERFRKLVSQIELNQYPLILERVERDFEKQTADVFFDFYFKKELALKQLVSLEEKDRILKVFFERGIVPWEILIGNNIHRAESVVRNLYQQDSDYFIRSLKLFCNTEFLKKVEEVYSPEFISFLKDIMENTIHEFDIDKQVEEKDAEIPRDVDSIIYYLVYYEKNESFPSNVVFSLSDLVRYLIRKFPEQAKQYFILAGYQGHVIVKQKLSLDVLSTIKEWIEPSYKEEGQIKEKFKKSKINELEEVKSLKINEPIYIVNAGLVLIHPFLQRFFSLCGLLEKRKFKDEESAQKAVHLLHYIVTKIDTPEEHQLVLDKILCGIPLSEPIDRTIELTDDERETCESLIRGVVENWPILKKTSNENFRVSLLQREGRLTREEGLWRLKVEEKSYDVLLDKLPWSISMIKLPWMEKMIQVEWR